MVINPVKRPASSTIGNFSILCFCKIASASFKEVPSGAVTNLSLVMTSPIRSLASVTNRKSRLVMIPQSLRLASLSTIGTPEMRYFLIKASASLTLLSGVRKNGSMITPLSERLTLRTSSACRSMVIFLWITPNPPWRAIAIAIADSVTVSIPALMIGIFNLIFLANCTPRSTSFGSTWLSAGINKTSSNVNPFFANFVSQFDITKLSFEFIFVF